MRKITVEEIAKAADVSIATVSRVLNHKGGYGEKTSQKVWKIAKRMGYLESRKKKKLIIVIVPDLMNEYFSGLVHECQRFFSGREYYVLSASFDDDPKILRNYIEYFSTMDVKGFILASGNHQVNTDNIPVVFIDRNIKKESNVSFVASDNVNGGYTATKELLESGCKRIAFITDVFEESSKIERYKGYCQALEEYGIPVNPTLIITVEKVTIDTTYKLMMKTLRDAKQIDGIFCTTDIIAVGAMAAIKDYGKRIPEDICVVGYDDISLSMLVSPSLTTIRQDYQQIVKEAGEILLKLINGENVHSNQKMIPVELIKRDSTIGH